jgi:hypothetical protein
MGSLLLHDGSPQWGFSSFGFTILGRTTSAVAADESALQIQSKRKSMQGAKLFNFGQ